MEHRAAEIHAGLKHPVIDGDGHWMEPIPIFLEYLREVGGPGRAGIDSAEKVCFGKNENIFPPQMPYNQISELD